MAVAADKSALVDRPAGRLQSLVLLASHEYRHLPSLVELVVSMFTTEKPAALAETRTEVQTNVRSDARPCHYFIAFWHIYSHEQRQARPAGELAGLEK
jgi:hypothetical protein